MCNGPNHWLWPLRWSRFPRSHPSWSSDWRQRRWSSPRGTSWSEQKKIQVLNGIGNQRKCSIKWNQWTIEIILSSSKPVFPSYQGESTIFDKENFLSQTPDTKNICYQFRVLRNLRIDINAHTLLKGIEKRVQWVTNEERGEH